ncbi:MAG TPA: redoxin domain-containing protein [Candidatus Goldiibacteriota bacterium]|nr:redoxin domain-containing protein [Candidatus Goldiibacteriota bacterium]HPI03755.1 redoxin domain-containing protein [Candidatus Goldiibacteriota bacterium]HPN64604.1 redoxin domain-containing protein [Candidatus Goldiibacteriota bacterium]HRQ44856.1 redoxin domain-containing protein [Candidatus Goldiibacteriota bacterium]
MLKPGESAGDFVLKNQSDVEVNTADFAGKRLLLSFHPLAWTSVCAKQMKSLEDNYEAFEDINVVPLGISCDPAPSKKAWAESLEIEQTDLLSDFWPHGEVCKKMDVFIEKMGISGRFNIILGPERKVLWSKIYPIKEVPDIKEVLEFLKKRK